MKKFYVYAHSHPVTHTPFYIGSGMGTRALYHMKDSRNLAWFKIVSEIKSQGLIFEVTILHVCDSEQEARDLEKIEIVVRTKSGQILANKVHSSPTSKIDYTEFEQEKSWRTFVRIKRKALGYTQEEMADRIGVSYRFFKEFERGSKSTFRMDKVCQVINYLGGEMVVAQKTNKAFN